MAEQSAIEWTDATFNPWIGCTKISPGCAGCYAEQRMDTRLHVVQWGAGQPRKRTSASNWREPVKWNAQHAEFFAQHGRRRRVFCASLADVFDNEVDREWRDDLATLILNTPHLDWLLLTKRIGNAGAMLGEMFLDGPPANIWLGATIVNQEEADRDIPKLLATPAAVRFLSMEPLLGPVSLDTFPIYGEDEKPLLHWIIVGGESGRGARKMRPEWARSLRDQCASANVPFLFKQWGEWAPYDRSATDGAILATPYSFDDPMQKFGKKLAGRLLDSRTHDGFPQSIVSEQERMK